MNFKITGIKELFKNGKQILQEEGFLSLLKKSLFSYSVVDLWENNLNGPIIVCEVDKLTLKIITELEEFDELLTIVSDGFGLSWYEMSIQQCRERLSKGAILFLALVGEEVASISWVGTTKISHGDFYSSSIDYKYEASIGGDMTAPKHQRKGIYTWLHSQIFQYLREKRRSMALFEIHKDNVPPQKAQIKLGSYVWGEMYDLRLLLFNFRWVKPKSRCTILLDSCVFSHYNILKKYL
jgi:GNAT superfamily N-acetyltransferase